MAQTVSIKAIRSDWQSRGFSCDIWTDPPGQVWEDYRHSVDELVMVLEGKVEFEVDGKILQPSAGEELFIPAGVLHSVRNKETVISRWLYGYRTDNRV